MLIKTQVNNKNGYQKSIANENRNIKTLRLTPKDLVNYNITFESFTPALSFATAILVTATAFDVEETAERTRLAL